MTSSQTASASATHAYSSSIISFIIISLPLFLLHLFLFLFFFLSSGQCDLFLRRAALRLCDVHRLPQLPPVAGADFVVVGGGLGGAAVPDVEQGRASLDL